MVADPLLTPLLLEYVSHVEGESFLSSDKDNGQDIGSVDKEFKNNEDALPIVQLSTDPTTNSIVYPSPSPIFPSIVHVPSPNAHVSCSTVAPTTYYSCTFSYL